MMVEQENKANRDWLDLFKKRDWHLRGCMIEGLAQELDFRGINQTERERIVFLLRGIAARVK